MGGFEVAIEKEKGQERMKMVQWAGVLLLVCVAVLGRAARGEEKQMLTMEQAVLPREQGLMPATLPGFAFRPQSDGYSYVDGNDLVIKQVGRQQEVLRLPLGWVNASLRSYGADTVRSWYGYQWEGRERVSLWSGLKKFYVAVNRGAVAPGWQLPAGADNVHESPSGEWISFNLGETIYIMDGSGQQRMVTADTAVGVVNGRSVHQNEFGIDGGIFWSPKGDRLAFYRMDESMVGEYPLLDISTRKATTRPFRYPMAGMASHHVTVGVYAVQGDGKVVWLQTGGDPEHYLTNVTFTPDGKEVVIAELNREQNHLQLNRYDAATGAKLGTLFEEQDAEYVEPLAGPRYVPGGKGAFVWESQRSGHNHLYLYSAEGKLQRALTEGEWDVLGVLGFSNRGDELYIYSNAGAVLERHVEAVPIRGGQHRRLSDLTGYHTAVVDLAGSRFAASWSNGLEPGGFYVKSLKKGKRIDLLTAGNPLEAFAMPEVELVKIKAADGMTDLYGRLIKPLGMEEGKKYPVIVYVYGGPHAQMVDGSWLYGARYWELLMAQRGYVVFVLDNRGSANRGFAFEQVIHRKLGQAELADQMEGVKFLKSLPYIDGSRMGVHGWSYGGFMSMTMLMKGGDTFKVGVSGGPVIDWKYYEIMYGERYMDRPQDNEDGYQWADLKRAVNGLVGKHLLMIHGLEDNVVVPQHTLSFMKACVDAGRTEVDAFFYPGHRHNVLGRDRIHLMNKVTEYFDQYLRR